MKRPTRPEDDVTVLDTPQTETLSAGPSDDDRPRVSDRLPALRPMSPVPTYLGIAVIAIGFVLLGITWGAVADETNVALQVPFLVSGGLTGLGAILVGLTIVSVAARRRDAALREQQNSLLADALKELSDALGQRR